MSLPDSDRSTKQQSSAAISSPEKKTGYAKPLFVEDKPLWTDERLVGGGVEKTDLRYHDKETGLNIVNGLCFDIFFRAQEIDEPWFPEVPECNVPSSEPRRHHVLPSKKPLDSRHKIRTPLPSPVMPEEMRGIDSRRPGQNKNSGGPRHQRRRRRGGRNRR